MLFRSFVPALSRLQNDPARYRRAFLVTYEAVALITFPVTALMTGLADPLTRVLFGPGWEGVTSIFASLAMAGLFAPLSNVATWIFYSSGRGKDWLRTCAVISALTIAAFAAGLPFGPTGVALAFSISGVTIVQPVLFYLAGRRGPVSTMDLWIGFLRYLPLWLVVYASSHLAQTVVGELGPFSQLLVSVPVALAVGAIFVCMFSPMRRSAMDVLRAARGFRMRHSTHGSVG